MGYHKDVMKLFDGFSARKRMERMERMAQEVRKENDEEAQAPAEQEGQEETDPERWMRQAMMDEAILADDNRRADAYISAREAEDAAQG